MLSVKLSNGTELHGRVDVLKAQMVVEQVSEAAPGVAPVPARQTLRIPLSDLKQLAETVGKLVKAFRS